MLIQTSRFGPVTLSTEDILEFPEGILGFNSLRKFVLLDDPNDEIFAWLQSCEVPGIAFPVLEPELFVQNYQVVLTKHDLEALHVNRLNPGKIRYFTIVTIPEDPTQMSANLKAPIVINVDNRIGRQCVLQDNHLAIREPVFARLQQRLVQHPSVPLKTQASDLGFAIRLPEKSGVEKEPTP